LEKEKEGVTGDLEGAGGDLGVLEGAEIVGEVPLGDSVGREPSALEKQINGGEVGLLRGAGQAGETQVVAELHLERMLVGEAAGRAGLIMRGHGGTPSGKPGDHVDSGTPGNNAPDTPKGYTSTFGNHACYAVASNIGHGQTVELDKK